MMTMAVELINSVKYYNNFMIKKILNKIIIRKLIVNNANRGFTLIELMVSISLYTVVSSVLISTVLMLSNVNVRLRNNVFAVNDMNLFLESLQRDIKMGSNFHCDSSIVAVPSYIEILGASSRILPSDCVFDSSLSSSATRGGGSRLIFKMQDGNYVSYNTDGTQNIKIDKYNTLGAAISSDYVFEGATNSTNIKISSLRFYVSGTDQTDGKQPTVTIKISGYSGARDQRGSLTNKIVEQQFTITPRSLDG